MARKPSTGSPSVKPAVTAGRPSALLDTRVIDCGDNLEQLAKLPDACVDLIYIDPPFNSNRNYEVFWGETKEKRSFEDRHASTQAYIGNPKGENDIFPLPIGLISCGVGCSVHRIGPMVNTIRLMANAERGFSPFRFSIDH